MHQLGKVDVPGGTGEYQSLGEDPQFDVRAPAGVGRIVPGWYVLTARCRVVDGEIITPCLYPDYGEGMSEEGRIDLPEPDGSGYLRALVVIKRRLRALRMDPTIHRAQFELSAVRLVPVSRLTALYEMLRSIARIPGMGARPILRAFLRNALRGRLSAATDALYRRYLDAHRESDRGYLQWTSLFSNRASPVSGADASSPSRRISIVLPVHNTPLPLLKKCIDSVLAQTYTNWQLCIADDVSSAPGVRHTLERYAGLDSRIVVHYRREHGHICAASNDALAMADGQYVGFLDHDDELAPDALAEVVNAIEEHPEARLLYSDEDKLDDAGRRYDPHFKPAWNPDLLRGLNYICHFTVIDRSLVTEVGGLRAGFEGAQDHDLVLRCTEQLSPREIVHIPKVLYHWRAVAGSTALGGAHKPYALEAGRRAVEEHLERIGRPGRVEATEGGHYRVMPPALDKDAPLVAIIVPTRDKVELLRACITSIFGRTSYPNYEVIVVDNGSTESETLDYLREISARPRIRVLDYAAPFNYSAIINHAARHVSAEVLCMLNNDIEVITHEWLQELVSHAIRPEVGVVGGMLYYPNDTIQHAGVILGIGGVAGHVHGHLHRGSTGYLGRAGVAHNLTAITGACMVLRRSLFEEVGGMDETLPVAFNDIDFCIRISQLGYDNVWTPHAELYHHESASRGLDVTPEKRARFELECERMKRKWGEVLRHDPAYNPNLSLDSCNFELAFPPRELRSRHADTFRAHYPQSAFSK